MSDKLKRTLLGAVIAVALAAAVSYGLISQQTADRIQTEANQALTDRQPETAPQRQPTPDAQGGGNPRPTAPEPDGQNAAPAPAR